MGCQSPRQRRMLCQKQECQVLWGFPCLPSDSFATAYPMLGRRDKRGFHSKAKDYVRQTKPHLTFFAAEKLSDGCVPRGDTCLHHLSRSAFEEIPKPLCDG